MMHQEYALWLFDVPSVDCITSKECDGEGFCEYDYPAPFIVVMVFVRRSEGLLRVAVAAREEHQIERQHETGAEKRG